MSEEMGPENHIVIAFGKLTVGGPGAYRYLKVAVYSKSESTDLLQNEGREKLFKYSRR